MIPNLRWVIKDKDQIAVGESGFTKTMRLEAAWQTRMDRFYVLEMFMPDGTMDVYIEGNPGGSAGTWIEVPVEEPK